MSESPVWNVLVRRFRSTFTLICPFCGYGVHSDGSDGSESVKNEVYQPRKDRGKHVRSKEKEKSDEYIAVEYTPDEDSGFTSKETDSNSQCFDVEVENSDELNRVMIRRSQFLPQEPYQPTSEEMASETATKDALLARAFPVKDPERPGTLAVGPAYPIWHSPASPDDDQDSTSQVSRSIRSLFGMGKKKKHKKDQDSQSAFSFKSEKSKSEQLERRERKRREKEEKRDKKQVEKQELRLSHELNNQKFENIYPWMNEPFEEDIDIPDVIEEIRIREAEELNKLDGDIEGMIIYEDLSYAAESFLDLGTQLLPASQISEPVAPVLVNKFGVPKDEIRRPFERKVSPLAVQPNKSPSPVRQMSPDVETEGVVRKARRSFADIEPSVSVESPTPKEPVVQYKKKDIFENTPLKKKDIFAEVIRHSTEVPVPKAADDFIPNRARTPTENFPKNIETKSGDTETDDRDLKKEIEEVTQRDEFRQTISADISERKSKRQKRKRTKKADRSERSRSRKKKHRSPTRIESDPIDDRSIDDIPVEKDLLADLTNPILFPEPSPEKKESKPEIPIVNYTRTLEEGKKKKDDADKVESIKEIQNTLDSRKKEVELSEKSERERRVSNRELRNETVRMVVDEDLVQNRMTYFDLDDGVLDHINYRGMESERDLIMKNGAPSGSRIPGQKISSENTEKNKGKKARRERSESRKRRDESEADREERKKRRRSRRRDESEADREERRRRRRKRRDSERRERRGSEEDLPPRRRSRANSDNEEDRRRKRKHQRDSSRDIQSEADADKREQRHQKRRDSRPEQDSIDDEKRSRKHRHSRRDRSRDESRRHRKREKSRDGPDRDQARSPARSPAKSPSRSPTRSPAKSPSRSPARSSTRSPKGSPKDHRRLSDAELKKELSPTFSNDQIQAEDNIEELDLPRRGSPEEVYEKGGSLKSFPSQIARYIKIERMKKKRREKEMEQIRQKMDLDYQSVDTKRSVFVSNENAGQVPLASSSNQKERKKDKKNKRSSKYNQVASKPNRVSSRPTLDPIRSQEEAPKHRPQRIISESDGDQSGSTLHSGDEKPQVIKRVPSATSNDSTLHDIGDIPSEWNVSIMTRSKQMSTRSADSKDSRLTHRSQLSTVRLHGSPIRDAPPAVELKDKKKKKMMSIF